MNRATEILAVSNQLSPFTIGTVVDEDAYGLIIVF